MDDEQLLIEEKSIKEVYIMKRRIYKVMVWTLTISMMLASMAGIGESERLNYDQIKDIIFNTTVDGERVFKYPSENSYFSSSGRQLRCNGAILITVPGIKDGELQIGSLFLVFNTENDKQETKYDIESAQQENVFELIGDSLLEYIDFESGGKITFCMTQSLEGESQILYEYSPLISQFSDKDLFKTQNYDEFDSFDAFKEKVYGVLYSANHGGDPVPEEKDEPVAEVKQDNTLQKGSKGDEVVKLQKRLNELGYSVGKADGDFGNKTKAAIEQFQGDNGLDVTGIADEKTLELLYSEDAVSKQATNDDASTSEQDSDVDEAPLIAAGMKYISNAVMDIAPALLSVSKEQCKITEIYYLDKGNHEYQFTARVSRGGPGGFGIGKDLTITAKTGGDYDIVDNNHVTLYSGSDKIPGELIFGDSEQASIARGMQILGNELGKLDANGDGELSVDEIFEMN